MPSQPREYYRPTDLAEAMRLLENPDAAPLAGGTGLLASEHQPEVVVDLQALGLSGIHAEGDALHIGATTPLAEIETYPTAPAILWKAVHYAGANTFRNAATLGGLVGSRDESSELLALLLTMDARLTMADGREFPLNDYLAPDEHPHGLITEVTIPNVRGFGALHRVARTPADTPIVSVVGWRGNDVRLAAVGIAARPQLISDAETPVTHTGDFRGSTEYRREMLAVLTRRVLDELRIEN